MPGLFLMPGKCCGCEPVCGTCCMTCSPCDIPKADLTLVLNGTTTTTLFWSFATTNWLGGTGPYSLACVSGVSVLTGGGTWTLTSSTCNPISLTFTSGGDTAVITGPKYGAVTCCQRFSITGCNGLGLIGVTVSVYDTAGGSLLATGVTSAGGVSSLAWSGPCSVYVTVTDSTGRLTNQAGSYTLTPAAITTISMLPIQSGYYCLFSGCAYPTLTTLHYTHSLFGSGTITQGGGWVDSSHNYSYPGCAGVPACASGSIPITIGLPLTTGPYTTWPVHFLGTVNCPGTGTSPGTGTEGLDGGTNHANTTLTCFTPSTAFQFVVNYTTYTPSITPNSDYSLLCATPVAAQTLTFTE